MNSLRVSNFLIPEASQRMEIPKNKQAALVNKTLNFCETCWKIETQKAFLTYDPMQPKGERLMIKENMGPCFVGGDIHPYWDLLLQDHLGIVYLVYTFQYSKLLCCGMSFLDTITCIYPILIQQPSGNLQQFVPHSIRYRGTFNFNVPNRPFRRSSRKTLCNSGRNLFTTILWSLNWFRSYQILRSIHVLCHRQVYVCDKYEFNN